MHRIVRLLPRLLLAAMAPLAACAPIAPHGPGPEAISAAPAAPPPPVLSDADRAFLQQAMRAEQAEQAAQTAGQHASRRRAVQVYAEDTANQVAQEFAELEQLAASHQVAVPNTSPAPALPPRFVDRDFLTERADAMQLVLNLARQEAVEGSDPDVKKCAALIATRTEQHMRFAHEVARRL